jgi:hypothetical protein
MSIAEGMEKKLSYVAESTYGETPGSPSMKSLRINEGENLSKTPETAVSNEIDGDPQIKNERHLYSEVTGDIPMPFCFLDADDILEALFGGTWSSTSPVNGTTISAASPGNTIDDSGSGFGDFKVGDWITTTGFTNSENNGTFLVTAAAAGSLTVDATLVTEAAGASVTVTRHKRLEIGSTKRSFTVEREYTDIARFRRMTGVVFRSLQASFSPRQEAVLTFGAIAKDAEPSGTTLGTPSAPSSNLPIAGIDVSAISVNGTAISKVTAIELNIDRGGKGLEALGSKTPIQIALGRVNVTAKLSLYYEDDTYTALFNAETEFQVSWSVTDLSGNKYHFTMDRFKASAESIDGGIEDPLVQALDGRALKHTDNGSIYVVAVAAP